MKNTDKIKLIKRIINSDINKKYVTINNIVYFIERIFNRLYISRVNYNKSTILNIRTKVYIFIYSSSGYLMTSSLYQTHITLYEFLEELNLYELEKMTFEII